MDASKREARTAGVGSSSAAMLAELEHERAREKRLLRWSVAVACLFHGVLLSITMPNLGSSPREFQRREATVFILQQPRFKPPPPRGRPRPPEKRKRKVPIPDPTPHEPEPILEPEIEVPEVEFTDEDWIDFGIPDAPPGLPGTFGDGEGPFQVGGNILPPVKVHSPQPRYTEEARMARIQGIVLLQAIVDTQGNVTRLQVLKGLPNGLTESALETVGGWRYEPATRGGLPVAVYLNLQIRFSLQ